MDYTRASSRLIARRTAQNIGEGVDSFNRYARQIAKRHGATYVDITDIATGNDRDPHPSEQGHRDIAKCMYNALEQQITDEMSFQPEPAPAKLSVSYAGHQQTYGDLAAVADGATLGHIGESKRLESVSATVSGIDWASIPYRGHVQGIGWTDWTSDGGLCGTTGQSKRCRGRHPGPLQARRGHRGAGASRRAGAFGLRGRQGRLRAGVA